ncbi:MAG: thioredoxin domain-containing protein [Verrucomicrobiota bacterium]
MSPAPEPRNRLATEKSPYLLQHAGNPVDWFPWGDEAFDKARAEDKPILVSLGYSTCHWCHVMERETFQDASLGAYLREHFVCVKVDREERPDVDKIHMSFVQMTTGGGGWPLNVFLLPDLRPFYGGTYFPPEPRNGRPSFRTLLERIVDLWKTRRADLTASASDLCSRLQEMVVHDPDNAFPTGPRELHGGGQTLLGEFDPVNGGFGTAPKFPRPSQPLYLLRYARRFGDTEAVHAVLHTCDRMAAGGIRDHLGGGFARYSVDERWLVPHFEKMLCDNAQLAVLYLEAFLVSGDARHAGVARDILGYVARDMTHPDGGFFSAEDADSEGKEGRFYCWTHAELSALLRPEVFNVAVARFGITPQGNFVDPGDPRPEPGLNVLSLAQADVPEADRPLLEEALETLRAARARRVRPHRDDKVLASWNGMMLGAFARAHAVLGDEEFRALAERNLAFLREQLWEPAVPASEGHPRQPGTLHHRWRDGERDSVQLLDAYAHLLAGTLELYEATLDPSHLAFAVELAEAMLERFLDPVGGGFWQSGAETPHLLVRLKEDYDGAEPSGNAVAALALLRLSSICARPDWREAAEKTLRLFAQKLHQTPQVVPFLLCALDFALQEPKRVVIVGDWLCGSTRALLGHAHAVFEPHRVILGNHGPVDPFARGLPGDEERSLAHLCSGEACQPPTRDGAVVAGFLRQSPPPESPW